MKKTILGLILFLTACVSANATWTCAQGAAGCTVTTARNCSTSGTSCSITVTSTHLHASEFLAMQTGSTSVTLSSTSDGGFTFPAAGHGTDASAGGVLIGYNLSATGSATSITCTFSAANAFNQCEFMEFTGTLGGNTFDTANKVDDSSACTPSCAGVALTLGTSNNYILIQADSDASSSSAINQSYTGTFFNGSGMAYKINVSAAGTTPNWTSSGGPICGSGLAVYESSGGGCTAAPNLPLTGAAGCNG